MRNDISGDLVVSDIVIADLVGYAASECYGVVGMASVQPQSIDGLMEFLPANKWRRGVAVSTEGDGLVIDVHVIVEYGVNISAVSDNLIDHVVYVLEHIARIVPDQVNVHVEGIKVRS